MEQPTHLVLPSPSQLFKPIIFGLVGPSCSGKTSLAKEIQQLFSTKYPNIQFFILHQDDFWKKNNPKIYLGEKLFKFWDTPQCLNWESFTQNLEKLAVPCPKKRIIMIEGHQLLAFAQKHLSPSRTISSFSTHTSKSVVISFFIYLHLDSLTCWARRKKRNRINEDRNYYLQCGHPSFDYLYKNIDPLIKQQFVYIPTYPFKLKHFNPSEIPTITDFSQLEPYLQLDENIDKITGKSSILWFKTIIYSFSGKEPLSHTMKSILPLLKKILHSF